MMRLEKKTCIANKGTMDLLILKGIDKYMSTNKDQIYALAMIDNIRPENTHKQGTYMIYFIIFLILT